MLYRANLTQDLSAAQIDANFRELRDALDAMIAGNTNVGIDDFDVTGDQMTVLMTDHTTRGPFTLPTARKTDRGAWAPLTIYFAGDTFTINGALYDVMVDHTSAASFDAGANDGMGHDFYHAVFSAPSNSLPAGGSVGMRLKKSGAGDYVTAWDWNYLDDLFDVEFSHHLVTGQTIVFDSVSGKWKNGFAGVSDFTADAHNFVTGFGSGVATQAQPAFTDISGQALDGQIKVNVVEDLGTVTGALDIDTTGNKLIAMSGNITAVNINDLTFFDAGVRREFSITATNSGHTYVDGVGAHWVGGSAPTVSNSFRVTYWTLDGGSNIYAKYETFV